MTEWQPIKTVPKDGTRIIAYFGGRVGVREVSWGQSAYDDFDLWVVDDCKHGPYYLRGYSKPYPTHWQPLPAPPQDIRE